MDSWLRNHGVMVSGSLIPGSCRGSFPWFLPPYILLWNLGLSLGIIGFLWVEGSYLPWVPLGTCENKATTPISSLSFSPHS